MIRNPVLKILLWLPVRIYAGGLKLRAWLYRQGYFRSIRVPSRVVCIGNLTVGGTGKTPFTLRVAELLQAQGQRLAILVRGYKRKSREPIRLVSDGKQILVDALASGDEAQWLARRTRGIPIVVGRSKSQAARWISEQLKVDWIVVDDGFQHLRLARDRNVLLLDADRPFDNGRLIPLGRLREPASAVSRADAVVWVKSSHSATAERRPHIPVKEKRSIPHFFASRKLTGISTLTGAGVQDAATIKGKKLVAFCGLGQPEQFFQMLVEADLHLTATLSFPDHHRYSINDLQKLCSWWQKTNAEAFITTAKDAINLPSTYAFTKPCFIAEMTLEIEEESQFVSFLWGRH